MKQMTFPLVKTIQRPIVYLKDWHNIYAMIDTGSLFPIWVAREDALLDLSSELLNGDVEFGGFGGKAKGRLYKMPYFRLGDLIYPDFHIVMCEMDIPCQMILPATMFYRLRYEIDDENHMFNVTVPDRQSNVRNLVIKDKGGRLHVSCTSGAEHGSGRRHEGEKM